MRHLALLAALALALLSNGVADPFYPALQNDPLFDRPTFQKVHDITVDADWKNVPLKVVLRDLTFAVRSTFPIRGDINFRFSSEAQPADRDRIVSLTQKVVPLYQLLEELSQQAGFTIKIRKDLVLIFPKPRQ